MKFTAEQIMAFTAGLPEGVAEFSVVLGEGQPQKVSRADMARYLEGINFDAQNTFCSVFITNVGDIPALKNICPTPDVVNQTPSDASPSSYRRKAAGGAAVVLGSALMVAGAAALVASGVGPALAIGAFLMAVGKAVLAGFFAVGMSTTAAAVASSAMIGVGGGVVAAGVYFGFFKHSSQGAAGNTPLVAVENNASPKPQAAPRV